MNSKKIIFVVGPTAVGKSDVALIVAQNINGEIISCDSMQIYREIEIASNKPSKDDLNKVPHYLVGLLSVEEEYDVAHFNNSVSDIINEIHNRDKIPIIVGGSGLYMQILLDGIFQGGIKNDSLRKDLKIQAQQQGNQYLYDKLKEIDPSAANKIHPNDLRRVIRSIEVAITEKMPISQIQKDRKGLWGNYDITLFALNRERQQLYDRINARVEKMFEQGLVEEIKALEKYSLSKTAEKIIAIQEVRGYLKNDYDLMRAKEIMKCNTRRLAKRQLTWFRKEKRLEWITFDSQNTQEMIVNYIIDKVNNHIMQANNEK